MTLINSLAYAHVDGTDCGCDALFMRYLLAASAKRLNPSARRASSSQVSDPA
ncbi:MAG: hypothetical protein PHX24_06460 [Acidithiobacillus sp.]|nr:hypothetical protein [Acidithiobacillus sp.]